MNKKAIIFGIKGYFLSIEERSFLFKEKPWGIILFSRNIKNIKQLKKLVSEIKGLFNDANFPILIDQEGGVVSRLNKITDLSIFSQSYFSKLYKKNKDIFYVTYKIYIDTVSDILKTVGININTVPVLDVQSTRSNKLIGTRSFSANPAKIIKLGNVCIDLYKKNKIATVVKHIPGHGASQTDTHFEKSIINDNKKKLMKKDFKTFKECKSLFAMTAHTIYSAYDSLNPATHSTLIIDKIIRKHINFKGILISDDISMKALKYNLESNAIKALKAGCNLVLHCNGSIKEMKKLAKVIPKIDKFTQEKTSQFRNFLM